MQEQQRRTVRSTEEAAKQRVRNEEQEAYRLKARLADEITNDRVKNISQKVSHRDACTEEQKMRQIDHDKQVRQHIEVTENAAENSYCL